MPWCGWPVCVMGTVRTAMEGAEDVTTTEAPGRAAVPMARGWRITVGWRASPVLLKRVTMSPSDWSVPAIVACPPVTGGTAVTVELAGK